MAEGRDSLDAQARYRPGDDQLLDLARAFEDRVAQRLGFSWCDIVVCSGRDQEFRESTIPSRVTTSTRF